MIKEWFLEKNFNSNERYVIELAEMNDELLVIQETEKAVQFKAISDFGELKFWCPKSCIYTEEEAIEEMQKKSSALKRGLSYNETLLALAKENGIKGVRKGMKTTTLIKKLASAGIDIPEK